MPNFHAEYPGQEILDLINKDLAARGYAPVETGNIEFTGSNLDNLKISLTISPIPSQPVAVAAEPVIAKAGRVAATGDKQQGKSKHYYTAVSELTPEEREAKRAAWRAKSQARRNAMKEDQQKEAEALVKAQAEANELEDIRMKSEMEVVAPSNPPFQQPQPEVRKRIPAGTPVLPATGIKYRGYPVEAAAAAD